MIKYDKTGIVKLKDDLNLDYGLYTKVEYIELTKLFNELVSREIFIKITDVKYDLILFQKRGIVHKEKLGKYYILKIDDMDLDDLLFNLVGTKINMHIESVEIEESEDIIK